MSEIVTSVFLTRYLKLKIDVKDAIEDIATSSNYSSNYSKNDFKNQKQQILRQTVADHFLVREDTSTKKTIFQSEPISASLR